MKKRSFIIRWGNRLLLLLIILVGLGSLVPSHILFGASVLSLILPVLIIPQMISLLITLRFSPRLLGIPLLGTALLFIPFMAQFPLGSDHSEPSDLRVASYNVRAFYQEESAAEKMAMWSAEQDIDILCMQEVRRRKAATIAERYPFRTYAPDDQSYTVAIYSTYPILKSGGLVFERIPEQIYARYSAQYADIALDYDTIRLINVHLSSTGVRDGDMSVEPNREDLMETGSFVAKKIAKSDKRRGLQSEHLLDWVKQSPYPVILTGDFNSVPGGNLYARLLMKLRDPYIFHGHGGMGSFEPLKRRYLPIKIDWTLHSPEIQATGQHINHVHLSDHYPLITTFDL